MTIIEYESEGEKKHFYMDGHLHKQLEKIKKGIIKKDNDRVIVIDGAEGAGKSVLAMQIGKFLDNELSINDICFSPDEFIDAIVKSKRGQCIIYDEAFTGLSSRSSLGEINRLLVSYMMEMRQRNLFVIIVMPTFFLLDKYVALWRAKDLFHVYTKDGRRGRWIYFNRKKKKLLYILGKKLYDYSKPKSKFRGRFMDRYTVDEKEYRKKKRESLHKRDKKEKQSRYKEQRDILFYILHKELNIKQQKIAQLCKKNTYRVKQNTISELITKVSKKIGDRL